MELGGTWIHPLQPNVWAEIKRYGLETEPLPVPEGLRQAILSGGRIVDLSDDDLARVFEALNQFCTPGKTLFPEPYAEPWGPDPQGYGDRSMREHLDTLHLEPRVRDWVEAMCCLVALGPLDQSAATEFFRTYVLSGWSAEQAMAALTATKLVKGTRELIGSIADQARLADIRLNTPVLRVAQTDGEVRVELANGDSISAPVGLIALPMNVLNSVEFEPPLSEIKRTASDRTPRRRRHEVLRAGERRHRQRQRDRPRSQRAQLGGDIPSRCGGILADRVRLQPVQAAHDPVR